MSHLGHHKESEIEISGSSVNLPDVSASLKAKVAASDSDQVDPDKLGEIYDSMARKFVEHGVNVDAVGAMAQYYDLESGNPLEYKRFPSPLPESSVRLCLVFFEKANEELAKLVSLAAEDVRKSIPGGVKLHLTKPSHYHITVFMTSQPHALRPNPFDPSANSSNVTVTDMNELKPEKEVLDKEIKVMRRCAAAVQAPTFRVHRLLMADSGTLLLCSIENSSHASLFNLRKMFRNEFPGAPPRQSTIYHTSVGRILTAEPLSMEVRERIQSVCDEWTERLRGITFHEKELYHVCEEQFTTVEGPCVHLPFMSE